jgi:hypothetical protein
MWFLSSQGWFYAAFNLRSSSEQSSQHYYVITSGSCPALCWLPQLQDIFSRVILRKGPGCPLHDTLEHPCSTNCFKWVLYAIHANLISHIPSLKCAKLSDVWPKKETQSFSNWLTSDKRSQALLSHYPQFFLFFDKRLRAILGASSEVQHAEIGPITTTCSCRLYCPFRMRVGSVLDGAWWAIILFVSRVFHPS